MSARLIALSLAVPSLLAACQEKAVPVHDPAETPARTAEWKGRGAGEGKVDGQVDGLGEAMRRLVADEAVPPTAADRAAAVDATPLVGRWQIRHILYRTDGVERGPEPPMVPSTWDFGPDGQVIVDSGMRLRLAYLYTGDRIIVTGMGPRLELHVDALTAEELRFTSRFEVGDAHIANTTVLRRVPLRP
ncbi:MAG: hypothetical protein EP329_00080 [Deltaproteobacteria bacterium]|nr:MAG: hypothetical protein EP329_00080 [Deltaproteobacteria bacterium]